MEMQTPCLDDPAVLVSVDFATKLKHGTNPEDDSFCGVVTRNGNWERNLDRENNERRATN